MKSVYLSSPGNVLIKDIVEPLRRESEVKIKILADGICGSDVAAYRGKSPLCTYPRILGHEAVGVICEECPEADDLRIGDLVVLEPYMFCGKCLPCIKGRTNCCEEMKLLGVHVDGAMCEYFCHPAAKVHKLSGNMPLEELTVIEPLSVALHANNRLGVKKGEFVLILGAGPIGNLAAQVALYRGAVPILADIVDERLRMAEKVNIPYTVHLQNVGLQGSVEEITGGRMADCIIEATGNTSAIRSTFDGISYTGRIALVGWPDRETTLPTQIITKKELDICGSRNSAGEFQEAIALIEGKKIDVRCLISKVVDFDRLPESIALLSEHPSEYLKIVGLVR